MNFNRKIFDEEIKKRIENPEWSRQIVEWVIARIKQNRKNKVVNIASIIFPITAAALLLIVLTFGIAFDSVSTKEQQIADISGVYSVLDSAYSLSYDFVDYYVEMYISQR